MASREELDETVSRLLGCVERPPPGVRLSPAELANEQKRQQLILDVLSLVSITIPGKGAHK